MIDVFTFFGLYLLASWTCWLSYVFIRSKVKSKNKGRVLLTLNLLFGLFLVTAIPLFLKTSGWLPTSLVLVLAGAMGISGVMHHVATIVDFQPWNGIITPKGLDVAVLHGMVSHLLFSLAYATYGFLILLYSFSRVTQTRDEIVLFAFVASVEMVAFIIAFDGVRMTAERLYD